MFRHHAKPIQKVAKVKRIRKPDEKVREKQRKRVAQMWRWFCLILMVDVALFTRLMCQTLSQVKRETIDLELMPDDVVAAVSILSHSAVSFTPDFHFRTPPRRPRRLLEVGGFDAVTFPDPDHAIDWTSFQNVTIDIPIRQYPNGTVEWQSVISYQDPDVPTNVKPKQSRTGPNGMTKKVYAERKLVQAEQERRSFHDPLAYESVFMLKDDADIPFFARHRRVRRLPFQPSVQHVGVLLDAGRHYFELDWIKNLLDVMEQLNFNLLHFRLTDDQAFAVALESHPELAHAAPPSRVNFPMPRDSPTELDTKDSAIKSATTNSTPFRSEEYVMGAIDLDSPQVYTVAELRELVFYAKQRRIAIMPEINVPGHAGGWAGKIPFVILPCPRFCCSHGYGLPLNISHEGIFDLIRDVVNETYHIFDTTPLIHLGGDEVDMAKPCFDEVDTEMFDYEQFERKLGSVLDEVNISHSNVVRWELTHQKLDYRINGIDHYWLSQNFVPRKRTQRSGRRKNPNPSTPTAAPTPQPAFNATPINVFASTGLYFDTNLQSTGWMVYENAQKLVNNSGAVPRGVIVGAFELSSDFWVDRNVIGRMLAVAMGVSSFQWDDSEFYAHYLYYCRLLEFPMDVCRFYGSPLVEETAYKESWRNWTSRWKHAFCERTTYQENVNIVRDYSSVGEQIIGQTTNTFWANFGKKPTYQGVINSGSPHLDRTEWASERVGIIVSLMQNDGFDVKKSVEELKNVLDTMQELGLNMLQLQLMDDAGCSFDLFGHLGWDVHWKRGLRPVWELVKLREVVSHAAKLGIEVVPEISLATRNGGWLNTGLEADCPNTIVERGRGAIDLDNNRFLGVLAPIISELYSSFNSEYIHLGFDERSEAEACYAEAELHLPSLEKFEKKLRKLLYMFEIPQDKVVRWERSDGKRSTLRAGDVTHIYTKARAAEDEKGGFFVSTGLDLQAAEGESKLGDGWAVYEQTRRLVGDQQTRPNAILAFVGGSTERHWHQSNMKARLLAFRMAVSQRQNGYQTSDTFSKAYEEACQTRGIDCKKGEFRRPVLLKKRLRSFSDSARSQLAIGFRTEVQKQTLPTKGVLVPYDYKGSKRRRSRRASDGFE